MYRIVHGKTDLPDAVAFLKILNTLDNHPLTEARELFDKQAELVVTRAPGRLDVMGGIADYSGSLVLELPIREATFVALQRDPIRRLRIVSLSEDHTHGRAFEMSFADLESGGKPLEYEAARAYFQHDPTWHWVVYVAGVFWVLMRERHICFQAGALILVPSTVPAGKGVSSSAALEVAVMEAICAAFAIEIEPPDLAFLC